MGTFESPVGLKNLILYKKIHHSNNNVRMRKKKKEEKGGRIHSQGRKYPEPIRASSMYIIFSHRNREMYKLSCD